MVRVLKGEQLREVGDSGALQGQNPGEGEDRTGGPSVQGAEKVVHLECSGHGPCAREQAREGFGGGPNHKAPWSHLRAFWFFC